MNRIRRSRLCAIAVLLVVPLVLTGCLDCESCFTCVLAGAYATILPCLVMCAPLYILAPACAGVCAYVAGGAFCPPIQCRDGQEDPWIYPGSARADAHLSLARQRSRAEKRD